MSAPALLPAAAWRACCWGLAALAVAWAMTVWPHAFRGYATERVALRIASGDSYSDDILKRIGEGLAPPSGPCAERFLRNALLIRARLAETALANGEMDRVDERFAEIEGSARELLACSPGQSFGWLALFWGRLQTGIRAVDAQPILRRSYETGPHELWIQARRAALTSTAFDQLPADLQARAVVEFAELLRAGAYGQAAAVLVSSGANAREKFLGAAADLSEEIRFRLSRVVRLLDSDIEIPGLRRPDRPWR